MNESPLVCAGWWLTHRWSGTAHEEISCYFKTHILKNL